MCVLCVVQWVYLPGALLIMLLLSISNASGLKH